MLHLEENYQVFMDQYNGVIQAALSISEKFYYTENLDTPPKNSHLDTYEIEDDCVYITYLEPSHCGCCGDEFSWSVRIPISILFGDTEGKLAAITHDTEVRLLAEEVERAKEAQKYEKAKADKEAEKLKLLEAKEYEEFLRLKGKFDVQ